MYSEGLESFLDYIRDCQMQYRMAQADEKESDDATQDLLHSLELDENSESMMLIISKVLKIYRNRRRDAKKRIQNLRPIVDWADGNKKILDELSRILGSMRKEEQRAPHRTYVRRTSILDNLEECDVNSTGDQDPSEVEFYD